MEINMNNSELKNLVNRLELYKMFGFEYICDDFLELFKSDKEDKIVINKKEEMIKTKEQLIDELKFCSLCELCKSRKNVVMPNLQSDNEAKIMLIFEKPTKSEDDSGKIFTNNSGFLELMDKVCNIDVTQIYATHLIKCKIPFNKKINSDILLKCQPFIFDEINIIRPKLIVTFGELCMKAILKSDENLSEIHGNIFKNGDLNILPMFDLSYIYKNPSKMEFFKEDLLKIKDFF